MISKSIIYKLTNLMFLFFRDKKHYNLPIIIGNDLLTHGKLAIFLLICIVITSLLIVKVTYNTRLLNNQREQLLIESNTLDMEWRNLILEENILKDHSRIEKIAKINLKMQHADPTQENIVLQSNNLKCKRR